MKANLHQISLHTIKDGQVKRIKKQGENRLLITYSKLRSSKDKHTRERRLKRLEKRIKSGNLTKANINNRSYNKYLKLKGNLSVEIDYQKFEKDTQWDGLKGYLTNAKLKDKQSIENYKNLWHIEKSFRMSKTDLRTRPIYHRLKHRSYLYLIYSLLYLQRTKTTIQGEIKLIT